MHERAASRIAVEGLPGASLNRERTRTRLVAAGGVVGALATSSCCVLPLILFSLGISGAWIGSLTALAPYKPYFLPPTIGLLGYGYCLVYLRPRQACAGRSCAGPFPDRLVKLSLWIATVLVTSALALDFVAAWLLA